MTISTTAASTIVAGNGVTTTFQFNFIADAAADITVTSIASNGAMTILTPSQYTLTINAANPNQLWGVGGTVTYLQSGNPIPAGQSLLIQRTLPLTQPTSVQNQGNYYAQVTELALDTLCMEIQQVAARTGQMRGIWAPNVQYNFGDSVVDGVNGNNTQNYYTCAIANTSSVWATELAAGDWSLALNIQAVNNTIGNFLPITGGTITGSLVVQGTFTPSGGITLPSNSVTTSSVTSGAITLGKLANFAPNSILLNSSASSNAPTEFTLASGTLLGMNASNIAAITLGSTLGLSANTLSLAATNTFQGSAATPTATTSNTPVMMGFGASATITPRTTGVVFMQISGYAYGANDSCGEQLRFGTGTAPVNGAALTGTLVGVQVTQNAPTTGSNTQGGAFTVGGIVTGLVVGTAYWIDLAVNAVNGNSSQPQAVSITAYEIK